MRLSAVITLALGLGLLALACQSSVPAAAPSSRIIAEPTPTILPPLATGASLPQAPRDSLSGQELFRAVGCAACHGQNAEGTDIAPPLPGHSASQVKRQARAPLGIMPVFPPDKVSNEELEKLAEYIESLSGGHAHVRAPGTPDEIALHHWMALFSLDAEDPTEAIHHLGHIMEVTEGQHKANMQQAIDLIEEGKSDDATHLIQQMLAGLEQVSIDEPTMQLTLALSSVRVEEAIVAVHHLEHFLEEAEGEEAEAGQRILDFLNEGKILEAEKGLEELLGEEAGDEEGHDDDEDEEGHDENN